MGAKQKQFGKLFQKHFNSTFGTAAEDWTIGIFGLGKFGIRLNPNLCSPSGRGGSFESGDFSVDLRGGKVKVFVEYDSGMVALTNLLKYWAYLRGDLGETPDRNRTYLLCHFSDCTSYEEYRRMWEWTLALIQSDKKCKACLHAQQFSNGITWKDGRRFTSTSKLIREFNRALDFISASSTKRGR